MAGRRDLRHSERIALPRRWDIALKYRIAAALAASLAAPCAAQPAPSALERGLVAEINRIRADPRGYADALRDYRRWFKGKIAVFPDGFQLATTEGVAAVDEAIAYLEKQAPQPPLSYGDLLGLAAQDHADAQRGGGLGHRSADGKGPGDRVRARGGDLYVAETITYGPRDAATAARQLIVDDGVPRRGHRRIVFSPEFRFAGAGCGRHATYGTVCVVDYAVTPTGTPPLPRDADR